MSKWGVHSVRLSAKHHVSVIMVIISVFKYILFMIILFCFAVEQACKYCCRGSDGVCQPELDGSSQSMNLADGKTCVQGSCLAVC
jgi:hypothetical protein